MTNHLRFYVTDEMFEVIKEDLEEFEAKKKSKSKNKGDNEEEMDCMDDEDNDEQVMDNEEETDDNNSSETKNSKRKLDSKVSLICQVGVFLNITNRKIIKLLKLNKKHKMEPQRKKNSRS